jgi:putative ABC transport system ATP-binding protein/lipoprotein-releasing system ATP-binding protein
MITLNEVTKTYSLGKEDLVSALNGVSLKIKKGEFMIIVGRSGSGKTTLLNLAAGLTRPTSGKILLDGTDLWTLTDQQQSHLRSQKFGFVFQFPSLLPSLTVQDNVILPTVFGLKKGPAQVHERALQLLQKVGLEDKLEAYPRQLSAGQQQRVVIARALMNQPQLLLADEPTSNLDEKTELEIMELFRELHVSMGLTIMMVTHTRQLVSYGTRAIEMANGQIVETSALPAAPTNFVGAAVRSTATPSRMKSQ